MAFDETFTLASPTGAALNIYAKHPEGPPRSVVQINHGLAEHAGRYAGFADYLAARGNHVYAHDHRGHGFTKAKGAPFGVFAPTNGADAVIADVEAIHGLIGERHPDVPVIVFGHSMGGLVALNFVLKHSAMVHGAAIWNANFSAGILAQAALALLAYERFRLGSDVPSRILPKLTFRNWARQIEGHRTEADWLTRDPAEVDAYIADPLCGWDATVGMWRDIFRLIIAGAGDRNFESVRKDLPFLLVGGEKDPATENGKAVKALAKRLRRMGFSNLNSTIYADTRHESLNELNRDVIMSDFCAWLDSILPQAGVQRGTAE
ncbi:alpha/beta hydrolase [Corticibacterium sp. UT-5YL-CI-8]|nr:alpha/beta hydrolase [Tianweitania sp. UT-5YL-CI-8]